MEKIIDYLISQKEIITILSLPLSLIAIILTLITLGYTIKTFLMKKGIDVKCSYSITSTVDCDDKYISNFIIENRKDKSILIFPIYMKIGNNYYLELEDFEDEPLIIKPFEVYNNSFDPIIMYSVSLERIRLNKLLDNNKVKKKILLYTTEGVYTVKAYINLSSPFNLFFENYSTAVIMPLRLIHNNKAYGENIKYLVDFISDNNEKSTLALRKDSFRHKHNNFTLTERVLKNSKELEVFFVNLMRNGKFEGITEIKVYDFEEGINERFKNRIEDKNEMIEAKYYGFFHYYILGKIYTIIDNFSIELENFFRNNHRGQKLKDLGNNIKMKFK